MDKPLRQQVSKILRPRKKQAVWKWAEENIIYQKPYVALSPGKYSSTLTPFWREPMDAVVDRSIREIWIVKNSQSGCSENVLLMPMRYAVCRDPKTILYIGGEQKATEEFVHERIKAGLVLSSELRERWARAPKKLEHQIYYSDMMIICGWAKSEGIFKQRPVDLCLADEVDTWPEYDIEKLRKRVETRPFPCIVGISALDAKKNKTMDDSPIWREYTQTDQRKYFMPDPKKRGQWFTFQFGRKDKKTGKFPVYGVKWDPKAKMENGEWDLEKVKASAHYVTPAGTKITEKDRLVLLEKGKWKPTRKTTDKTKRGYHINSMYMPWISFGELAVNYLKAKAKGQDALQVFVYEDLAEEWKFEVETTTESELERRQADYPKGMRLTECENECPSAEGVSFKEFYVGKQKKIFLTTDVQKHHMWWIAREWIKGGDSGLLDFGTCVTWAELDKIASVGQGVGASHVLVDAADGTRAQEIYEASFHFRFIPIAGKDNIPHMHYQEVTFDPFRGRRGEGKKKTRGKKLITMIYFRPDPFKSQLIKRIAGDEACAWHVYDGIEKEYIDQVTSVHRVNGIWDTKEGTKQDHLFDGEMHQLLAATRWGYNWFPGLEVPETDAETPGPAA